MIHIERINQENQQIISQNNFKTYNNGKQAHTNFGNSSGYKVHSLYIRYHQKSCVCYAEINHAIGAL